MSRIGYIEDFASWQEGFEFYHPVKVRFSEIDMFGHLNNTVPFTYYEEARIHFFNSKGLMQEWLKPENESIPVVADLQCDFLKQVYLDEELRIYVKVNKIGNSSIDIHYMGLRNNDKSDICFVGRGTIVQMSKLTGKGVKWTDRMKELLHGQKQSVGSASV
ncbi:acyl-CoA thioesterase [Cytobacillus sp. FJAT-54145]|uniref:Acyl-CoA thioesterase n=1 Tax=Cytobacillus spartinae TaxID=3299023 RepID=A0ABW6KHW9_9BACI